MIPPDDDIAPGSGAGGPPTADEIRGREALAHLSDPPARAEFRARLAREFAAGRIAPSGRLENLAPAAIVEDPLRLPRPGVPVRRRSWREYAAGWGLPAAAAAVLAAVVSLNHGEPWRVVATTGEGIAIVDGRPMPLSHDAEMAASLRPGSRLRIPAGCALEVESGRALRLQLAGGTDAVLPAPPARWFGRGVRSQIRAGELRIATGTGFHGARLAVTTPVAVVEVTGTTLAVTLYDEGTCVCVHEGRVRVGRDRGDMAEVSAGRRRFVYNDRRPDEPGPIEEQEVPELERLRGAMLAPAR
jgi:ferric-dicitrate binding protein FerR (iron transport regulator)